MLLKCKKFHILDFQKYVLLEDTHIEETNKKGIMKMNMIKDNLFENLNKTTKRVKQKNIYNLKVTPTPLENKIEINTLNNENLNNNANIINQNLLNNNNFGYINEENSNIIQSTKLRFDNIEEIDIKENIKKKYIKKNTAKVNLRLDMGIVNTYIRSKTDKGKSSKINTTSDSL